MTFEKASSLGYSGKCRLKVKTSCKGKGGREGEKHQISMSHRLVEEIDGQMDIPRINYC